MTRSLWPASIGGTILLIGWLANMSMSGPPTQCPRPCPRVCVPNVRGFGYFETQWRRWPGERRPEQINPRSIGVEVVPTPAGSEEVPPPRATMPRPAEPAPQGEEPLNLPEGQIVPPEGLLLPGARPGATPSGPPPGGETKPLYENGLPGLPDLKPEQQPEPLPEMQPEPKPEPKSEPKPAANAPKKSDPDPRSGSRYAAPRRETASSPAAPKTNEGGLVPWTGGMEPERNDRYDVPRREPESARNPADRYTRDGGVVPVSGNIEPERNAGLNGAYRAETIGTTAPVLPAERVEPAAYATAESAGTAEAGDLFIPPVALNGYCPVELARNGRWAAGDIRWTVVHKGLIYRLSGDRQRLDFLADPDRYAPVDSGKDRVTLVDRGKDAAGRLEFCAMYEGRLYMFSSEANQSRFNNDPQRYAGE